jgi:hypothetical protein
MLLSIQTKTNVTIGDTTYSIEYPNVGQVLDIENLKILLSGDMYSSLVKSVHKTGLDLLNLIDGVAYFSVLADGFKKKYDIEKFTAMGGVEQAQIKQAFVKQFWPWFVKIEQELNKPETVTDGEN